MNCPSDTTGAVQADIPVSASEEFYALANSLAHEIRNPLNALQLNLKLLGLEVAGHEKATFKVEAALKEVRRLDDLVTSFLRFARPRQPNLSDTDLVSVVKEFRDFVAPEIAKRGKELALEMPDALGIVTDADFVKQALLNVVLNALEFSAQQVSIDVTDVGDAALISVSDDGPGFSDPQRALQPFFSTKPEGNGLGLPTALSVARALGGDISIASGGPGTKVIIRLPKKPS